MKKHSQNGESSHHHHPIKELFSSLQEYRPSFLYFLFGFLFPPLWIIGALYMKRSEDKLAKADLQWKRRSQHALTLFLLAVLLIILSILIFKPSALGWRKSNKQ
ncbi:uncharacterized protein BX664DRAFT_331039 [Halteromyces radiatus]|uniref:uncharacterized protein n=1 Tax=Halteromyces radiatus TaxID=101107 RepID=UPI00221FF3EE|nr:uncharacterized protein BX664DRAFT_331039 [Halteromyces radiatus]KAI8088659.1 hypothetical protein BX664DRAFT_331039 [Halteromyces radiatus]